MFVYLLEVAVGVGWNPVAGESTRAKNKKVTAGSCTRIASLA